MTALAVLDKQLVAATQEGEVASSSNGVAWTWVGTINQMDLIALGTDAPQATAVAPDPNAGFTISTPYPNPRVGTGGVTLGIALPTADRVRLELYDARGRLCAARSFEAFAAGGQHAIEWNPAFLGPGTYFVRMISESGRTAQAKWTVIR
jgi:hypothetical protein